MRELETYDFLSRALREGNAALMVVVESKGSSPGRQGFKMAVAPDGSMSGSIGGGIMEHKLVEWMLDKLKRDEPFFEIRKQIHSKEAAHHRSGMICSGEQTIALFNLRPDHALVIGNVLKHSREGKNGTLLIRQDRVEFHSETDEKEWYSFRQQKEWVYKEKTGPKERAYVVGAGHVGLEMCRTLAALGFYVTTFDDREGLNTLDTNIWAHEKIMADYAVLGEYIPEGDNSWVIVMTFGYRTDDVAVRSLLGKKFRYFGMMGSRAKVDTMMEELKRDYAEEVLAELRAPAGLPIASKTPAEIAVSIAAEMIAIRNR